MQYENVTSRRGLLGMGGSAVLSVAALGILANQPLAAQMNGTRPTATPADVDILNVALGLEHEAIDAYQIGAESGLLQRPVLDVAVLFQGHHKAHRDALIGAIRQMGGSPVMPKSRADYMASLEVSKIRTQADILRLAQRLEKGAANAYLGVIPAFGNKDLGQIAGRLASDETAHWALLSQVLGDNLPSTPFVVS